MNQGNGMNADYVKDIIKKVELYADSINTDLSEFNSTFESVKECYEGDGTSKLFSKYQDFNRNYKMLYTRLTNYNKILTRVLENYEKVARDSINRMRN